MASLESTTLSALLNDKQVHIMFQGGADSVIRTHSDVWGFIREYAEKNQSVPPVNTLSRKTFQTLITL